MAISKWHMFIVQHDKTIGFGIAAILIFLLGWQAGRIMSPYYASSQIVFEDRVCSTCPSSTVSEGTKPPVSSTSAGISDSRGTYVGSKSSTLFHHSSCSSAKRIKAENQVWYTTYDEATQAGRTPSTCTQKLPR